MYNSSNWRLQKSHHSATLHIPYESEKSVINTFKQFKCTHISKQITQKKHNQLSNKFFLNFIMSISNMQRRGPFFLKENSFFKTRPHLKSPILIPNREKKDSKLFFKVIQ